MTQSFIERRTVDLRDLDLRELRKHYIFHGHEEGRSPNYSELIRTLEQKYGGLPKDFDPQKYICLHEDLNYRFFSDGKAIEHYLCYGRAEGRPYKITNAKDLLFPTLKLDPDRETVVVAVHDAARSGAPILAWNIVVELQKRYNVVALLKRGGAIEQAFHDSAAAVVCLPDDFPLGADNIEAVVDRVVRVYSPKYVIANSVETRHFVRDFEERGVPVVVLVHEFSSYFRPSGTLASLFESASQIVFPAQIVAESAIKDYKILKTRGFSILAQGATERPLIANQSAKIAPTEADGMRPQLKDGKDSLLVVGIGTVEFRKGVDIFLSTAALVRRAMPDRQVKFAWAGKCLPHDTLYQEFLKEQVQRSGLDDAFVFLGEIDDVEAVYAQADILFLPSRLDPLPNAAIDAAFEDIPVICFDQASGIAEILKEIEDTKDLVVPHLDADAAAQLICNLARDPARLASLSKSIRALAEARFDMPRYIDAIDQLGRKSCNRRMEPFAKLLNSSFSAAFRGGESPIRAIASTNLAYPVVTHTH